MIWHNGYVSLLLLISITSGQETDSLVYILDGTFSPLYTSENDPDIISVGAFLIDRYPVTNSEFLEFVKVNPQWRRSQIKKIFADNTYLQHWPGDLELGDEKNLIKNSPVTCISWYAARAYAKWKGKRLPTLAEWEYVAAASEMQPYGRNDPEFLQRILNWYSKPTPVKFPSVGSTFKNYWGLYDLHGLIWEWVADFNTALVTGESRADSGLDRQFYCGSASIGASDFKDYAAFMRYGFRSSLKAHYTIANLGFRCARDIKPEINEQK